MLATLSGVSEMIEGRLPASLLVPLYSALWQQVFAEPACLGAGRYIFNRGPF